MYDSETTIYLWGVFIGIGIDRLFFKCYYMPTLELSTTWHWKDNSKYISQFTPLIGSRGWTAYRVHTSIHIHMCDSMMANHCVEDGQEIEVCILLVISCSQVYITIFTPVYQQCTNGLYSVCTEYIAEFKHANETSNSLKGWQAFHIMIHNPMLTDAINKAIIWKLLSEISNKFLSDMMLLQQQNTQSCYKTISTI